MPWNNRFARNPARALALLLALSAQTVCAVVIGFEGTGVAPNGVISPIPLPYHESGFVLRNSLPAPESGIFGANTDGVANSGSDFFGWSFGGAVLLEAEGGDPFTLNAFDAGHIGEIGLLPDFLTLRVTGNLSNGGSVVVEFEYTVPWFTFVLPATFTDLSSVVFLTSLDGGGGIDNIVINETARGVPDAGSPLLWLALVAVALAAAGAARPNPRRHRC